MCPFGQGMISRPVFPSLRRLVTYSLVRGPVRIRLVAVRHSVLGLAAAALVETMPNRIGRPAGEVDEAPYIHQTTWLMIVVAIILSGLRGLSRGTPMSVKPAIVSTAAVIVAVVVSVGAWAQENDDCHAGLVVEAGESCMYPGTDVEFQVDDSGSGRFLFLVSGQRIELRATSINGVEYTFVASKQSSGGWLIEEVGSPASVTSPTTAAAADDAASDGYSDVGDSVHKEAITALGSGGVLAGTDCGPGEFCPTGDVQRWVMAVWMVRVLDGGDPDPRAVSRFEDVNPQQWWTPHVERLADLGITAGCSTSPARFCPHQTVTRARMASFLVRAFNLPPASPAGFVDVGTGVHTANINALAASGITAGCKTTPPSYCPSQDVTRAQMATFLLRAKNREVVPDTTNPDREALVALYNATNGANWETNTNWLSNKHLNTWHGVTTDASGRVASLWLNENKLSGPVPSELAGLTNLTQLWLDYNSITDISPLAGLTNLTHLSLSDNSITDLSPLAGLTNLTQLWLDYNIITDLSPLAGLTNLTHLSLSDTEIQDLSVLSDLTNLTLLRLIATNTTDVSPLSSLTKLTSLALSHNRITDISPLAGLTELRGLNFWENQIEDISPLAGLTNLTALGIALNSVEEISALSDLTNLAELSLMSNNITDISPLANLTNLTWLYLSSNNITDISALANLTNLAELDLQGNTLSDSSITEHVPALESRGVTVLHDRRLHKGDFDIELVFLDDFTETQQRVLQHAARRWMAVIVDDLPDYVFPQGWSGRCGGHSFEIPSGERIDDLRIYVATQQISAHIHGTGGPNILREETHLPVVGCMTFDLSHANLPITGAHEIGHVLGFASEVWDKFGFYQNPPNGDGHFNGPLAIAAFDDAGGSDYTGMKVPLHNGESHWSVSVLEGELMTPYGGNSLSAITVQALADLGYGVEITQADPYTLPAPTPTNEQ